MRKCRLPFWLSISYLRNICETWHNYKASIHHWHYAEIQLILLGSDSEIARSVPCIASFSWLVQCPRSHHKGATGRVRTGDQLYPVLCHCHLGQDIPMLETRKTTVQCTNPSSYPTNEIDHAAMYLVQVTKSLNLLITEQNCKGVFYSTKRIWSWRGNLNSLKYPLNKAQCRFLNHVCDRYVVPEQ